MKFRFARFNIYLAAALALVWCAGCSTSPQKKEKKQLTLISLHLEAQEDQTEKSSPVPVFREKPVYVNVEKEPFLDQRSLDSAKVVDDLGGFHIQLKFNWEGTLVLDGVTADNHKRRVAIQAKWDKESRWLASPLIQKRASDGIFNFTPDASREEADRIVRGLNNFAAKVKAQDKL